MGGGVYWMVIVCGGANGSSDGGGFGRGAWGGGNIIQCHVKSLGQAKNNPVPLLPLLYPIC